jgi:hypothetical protein
VLRVHRGALYKFARGLAPNGPGCAGRERGRFARLDPENARQQLVLVRNTAAMIVMNSRDFFCSRCRASCTASSTQCIVDEVGTRVGCVAARFTRRGLCVQLVLDGKSAQTVHMVGKLSEILNKTSGSFAPACCRLVRALLTGA